MIKINLITSDIRPYLKQKKERTALSIGKMVLILLPLIIVGVVSVILMSGKNVDEIHKIGIVQDSEMNLPEPGKYSDKKDQEPNDQNKSNLDTAAKRSLAEERVIEPNDMVSEKKITDIVPDSKLAVNKNNSQTATTKQTSTQQKKYAVVKKASGSKKETKIKSKKKNKVTASRIENYVYNEGYSPHFMLSKIDVISDLKKIRMNNPQTLYLELGTVDASFFKSTLQSKGLKVKTVTVNGYENLEVSVPRAGGKVQFAKVTDVPELESKLSHFIAGYGGAPVLKDNSKPLGKYFNYTVKYVIPKISYTALKEIVSNVSSVYEGVGISKIVYDNDSGKLKIDISIYSE